ncbi:MAG: D-Ala-D-Ala carboxypeptidase family metallohydrolase [Bacteroidales bacterium]
MKITYSELIYSSTAKTKGIDNTPGVDEKQNLIKLMDWLNEEIAPDIPEPVNVESGYRCESLNKAVGGVGTSHHLTGYACDLSCSDLSKLVRVLKNKIDQIDQLIHYPSRGFVHVSIHPRQRHEFLKK